MAAPGFGFSFGDFVAAIKIVKDVSRALRETGGAKDEFKQTTAELQHLEILLEQLNHGSWDHGGDAGHLNAIKGMALTCRAPLQDFLDKINKYKSLQQPNVKSLKSRAGSQARKVQWAIEMKEEVEKFRAIITAKIVSINLLIQLHSLSNLSRMSSPDGTLAKISTDLQTKIQDGRSDIQQLTGDINKLNIEQSNTRKNISTLLRICTGGEITMEDFRNQTQAQHIEVQRRFTKLEELHGRGYALIVSSSETISSLDKAIRQLGIIFGGFSTALMTLLKKVLRTELENYALLREMHGSMLRAPIYGQPDLIQFTDALGRCEQLPYTYFRYWDVFEAMLKVKFKELPGEQLVQQGQYHLLDTKRKSLSIDRSRWEKTVFPGTDVSMSMLILGMLFTSESCPRPTCGFQNTPDPGSPFITCSNCNLQYRCVDGFDAYQSPTPLPEGAVDHECIVNLTEGGQTMFRSEGIRSEPGENSNQIESSGPLMSKIEALGELEAFKSIYIQTIATKEVPQTSDFPSPPILVTDTPRSDDVYTVPNRPVSPASSNNKHHTKLPTPESKIGLLLNMGESSGITIQLMSVKASDSYAVLYAALDHNTREWYAVKAFYKVDLDGAPLPERFLQLTTRDLQLHYEASSHPNIQSIFKIIDDPSYLYVVLQYPTNGDLFDDITQVGRYIGNDDRIRSTFLQILSAVQHCHSLGIYHRDLKPENITLIGDQILLAEFGLATRDYESTDFGVGTLFYMSPECLEEQKPAKAYRCGPSDIWSLGIILINLTCGRNPWREASQRDPAYRAYLSDRNFLISILPLSTALHSILTRILEPDVDKRIQIQELIAAIAACPSFSLQRPSDYNGLVS